jgi:hypothetical protein
VSRLTVRHAAADFLKSAALPSVGTIYASPPKLSRGGDAYEGLPPGAASGSVIYVEVLESHETREGFGGVVGGKKMVKHLLRLHIMFRSKARKAEDAMDDHDVLLEALLAAIRGDRTLATATGPNPILQVGEGINGIKAQSGMPRTEGTASETIIWTIIDADADEFITA